jgi:hypothetical protein
MELRSQRNSTYHNIATHDNSHFHTGDVYNYRDTYSQRQRFLDWIRPLDQHRDHESALAQYHRGTLRWFFDDHRFHYWQDNQHTNASLAHHVEKACFLSSFAAFAAALRRPATHLLSAGNICLGAWTAVYDDALGISDLECAGFLAVLNVLIVLPLIAIVTGICLYRESVYTRRYVTPFIFGVLF